MPQAVSIRSHRLPERSGEATLSAEEAQQLSRILARLNVQNLLGQDVYEGLTFSPEISTSVRGHAKAKSTYDARQRRARFFPRILFSEPAWDILLILYMHHGVSRLCIKDVAQLVDAPATTLLRWIKTLKDLELVTVRKHPLDRRVSLLGLTDLAISLMADFLGETTDRPS